MMNNHWKTLNSQKDLLNVFQPIVTPTAGKAIGIIAVDLVYPKIPGNVVNATTFDFPVDYEVIDIDIELLFEGHESVVLQVIEAAKRLEARGVRAIVGACGYFANFQAQVTDAVDIPVFLSSLLQIPLIKVSMKPEKKIAVFVASSENADSKLFAKAHADIEDCLIVDVGSLEKFQPIRRGYLELDNEGLTRELIKLAEKTIQTYPEIGSILLECSDLPPYSYAIQGATNLPVFDFNTLINYVWHSVVQKPYFGYF